MFTLRASGREVKKHAPVISARLLPGSPIEWLSQLVPPHTFIWLIFTFMTVSHFLSEQQGRKTEMLALCFAYPYLPLLASLPVLDSQRSFRSLDTCWTPAGHHSQRAGEQPQEAAGAHGLRFRQLTPLFSFCVVGTQLSELFLPGLAFFPCILRSQSVGLMSSVPLNPVPVLALPSASMLCVQT